MDDNNINIHCKFYFEDSHTNRKNLFKEALTSARNGKVLYILQEEINELPHLSQDLNLVNQDYMKMISFLYAKTLDSLIETVSTLPDWRSIPCTIILDDLSEYCGKVQNACGVVAFLIDTIRNCSKCLQVNCRLLVSVTRESVDKDYCSILKELYCTNE